MALALIITIPTLLVVVCITAAYERDICIVMLDWLQQFGSRRDKPSYSAIGRWVDGHQKALKSR
jgi:hypothetical protein